VVGFSDTSTWMLPLTLRLGWASIHGTNLMDTPYLPPDGVLHWLDVAGATGPFTQRDTGHHRGEGWDRWEDDPTIDRYTLDTAGEWTVLGGGSVDVSGRLVGGCIETMVAIAGTPYGDVAGLEAPEGTVVYLEASDHDAYNICRDLHGLRYAGWFDRANAVLIGRTRAPDGDTLTQHQAVEDALGMLGVPVVVDVDCGHVPPYLPLVNGAVARVVVDGDRREITQEFV
jgi:muramoyltetrapeptide carboxypeptidase LdcA involved in peptidoglycan recycling